MATNCSLPSGFSLYSHKLSLVPWTTSAYDKGWHKKTDMSFLFISGVARTLPLCQTCCHMSTLRPITNRDKQWCVMFGLVSSRHEKESGLSESDSGSTTREKASNGSEIDSQLYLLQKLLHCNITGEAFHRLAQESWAPQLCNMVLLKLISR